jgi:hypothetical protein
VTDTPLTADLQPRENALKTAQLLREVDAGAQKALVRFGAFVRRRMMTSIRYAKNKSRPGDPPRGIRAGSFTRERKDKKTGATVRRPVSPLRELIAFAVIEEGDDLKVIIGPMIFRSSTLGGGRAPRLLEEGGGGVFLDKGVAKYGRYAPRPFVGPAFRAELPGAPKLFGGSVGVRG